MSSIQIEKARIEDYEEVINLSNYVFSMVRAPIDFPVLIPKLCKREYFMDGITYILKDGKRIIGVTGAYPINIEFSGGTVLPGRGIGMVAVHPDYRFRGYMKELMNIALDDMKKDNMAFCCLAGRRHRYETYGFTPAGSNYVFNVNEDNISHTLGKNRKSSLDIKLVTSEDSSILDQIQRLHEAKSVRMQRSREKLFYILSSWKARVFAVLDGDKFEGYFVYRTNLHDISEINLNNISRIGEVIDLVLRRRRENYFAEAPVLGSISVTAGPNETEKLAVLSGLAESCSKNHPFQFNILDFKRFVEPFIKLKAGHHSVGSGSFAVNIRGTQEEKLVLGDGTPSPKEIDLNPMDAVKFFFSPFPDMTFPVIRENGFLQNLLPLPLFFESADQV